MTEQHHTEDSFVPVTEVRSRSQRRRKGYWTSIIMQLIDRPEEAFKIPLADINQGAFRSNMSITARRLGVKVSVTYDDTYAYVWIRKEEEVA